jgi:Uma2 family endonuclease
MATRSQARTGMTLEEFLNWPRIDEQPYLEYHDGQIEVKVSPQRKHSAIQWNLTTALNQFANPSALGAAYPELRCTFAGRSIVPDVVFQLEANIPLDEKGELLDECLIPPDIHIEIRSPDQSVKKTRQKLEHSVANGCPLGWYIDPERRTVDVYRPGLAPERLPADGFLDGAPVLPGFRVAVTEVFGWLIHRRPEADPR